MGCGEALRGGKCNDSEDVENCIFSDFQQKGVNFCTGSLKIYQVP